MMKEQPNKVYFMVAVGVQLIVIFALIIFKAAILTGGVTVFLEIAPVDPRDPLRGDFVTYQYEISSTSSYQVKERPVYKGDTVYVTLEKSYGRTWDVQSVQKTKPQNENDVFIRATALNELSTDGRDILNLRFDNIEQYFIPEGTGQNFSFRGKEALAEVVVDKNGAAVLKEIYIDGKPWNTVTSSYDDDFASGMNNDLIGDVDTARDAPVAMNNTTSQSNMTPEELRVFVADIKRIMPLYDGPDGMLGNFRAALTAMEAGDDAATRQNLIWIKEKALNIKPQLASIQVSEPMQSDLVQRISQLDRYALLEERYKDTSQRQLLKTNITVAIRDMTKDFHILVAGYQFRDPENFTLYSQRYVDEQNNKPLAVIPQVVNSAPVVGQVSMCEGFSNIVNQEWGREGYGELQQYINGLKAGDSEVAQLSAEEICLLRVLASKDQDFIIQAQRLAQQNLSATDYDKMMRIADDVRDRKL